MKLKKVASEANKKKKKSKDVPSLKKPKILPSLKKPKDVPVSVPSLSSPPKKQKASPEDLDLWRQLRQAHKKPASLVKKKLTPFPSEKPIPSLSQLASQEKQPTVVAKPETERPEGFPNFRNVDILSSPDPEIHDIMMKLGEPSQEPFGKKTLPKTLSKAGPEELDLWRKMRQERKPKESANIADAKRSKPGKEPEPEKVSAKKSPEATTDPEMLRAVHKGLASVPVSYSKKSPAPGQEKPIPSLSQLAQKEYEQLQAEDPLFGLPKSFDKPLSAEEDELAQIMAAPKARRIQVSDQPPAASAQPPEIEQPLPSVAGEPPVRTHLTGTEMFNLVSQSKKWKPGSIVKTGFIDNLQVVSKASPNTWNLRKGNQNYLFVPFKGLYRTYVTPT